MSSFEIGRLLGKLEVIVEDIPDSEKEIEDLKFAIQREQDNEILARIYGRIEQKLIITNKNEKNIQYLRDLFRDIENLHIEEYKKKRVEELHFKNVPKKALNNENIFTVQDLCNKTFQELKNISGVSELTVRGIERELKSNGIYLKQE